MAVWRLQMATTTLAPKSNGKYVINGGTPLKGTVFVPGAKNAALPIIAAALLVKNGQTILRNVPPLNDVRIQMALAQSIGARINYDENERILVIDASSLNNSALDTALTTQSRASILLLPPVLYRLGRVEFRGIGGCSLGLRRLDFHHNGFKRLGAAVEGDHDDLVIEAEHLSGNLVYLDIPSQTSTENLMMAACLAHGTTVIENAASEPEVVDFAHFLISMGADIQGAGSKTITIEGVTELKAVEHTIMSDRLDAGPFMMAAAITGGDIELVGAQLDEMRILVAKLEQMGVKVKADGPVVRVKGPNRLRPVNVVSCPYPGFSTDFLPAVMALACVASGTSYLRESVFEDRFTQAEGLSALGANISKGPGNLAQVEGIEKLHGAHVTAPDLRAGMSIVLAALIAEGETVIDNIYQIERGHADVDIRLRALGASITRQS